MVSSLQCHRNFVSVKILVWDQFPWKFVLAWKIIQKSEPVLKILFRLKVCGITLSEASSVPNITIAHDDIQIHMLSAVCSNSVEQTMKSPHTDGAGEGR